MDPSDAKSTENSTPKSAQRFTDRVENYIKYRPKYPNSVIHFLQDKIRLSKNWTVLDVGSGTGISSHLFLDFGCSVVGIDPNDLMIAASSKLLQDYIKNEQFSTKYGTAESLPIVDNSIDLLIAGQAFHWFDPSKFRSEA